MSPEAPEALALLLRVAGILEELGILYHLGGSFASSVHGIPRQTRDIDLVVELEGTKVRNLLTRLGGEFYVAREGAEDAVRTGGSFNAVHLDSAMKVDFFVRGHDPYDLEEFRRSRPEVVQVDPERRVMVKSAEDILLRKLQWYRKGGDISDRQWSDVLGIVRTLGSSLDADYVRHWGSRLGVSDLVDRVLGGKPGETSA